MNSSRTKHKLPLKVLEELVINQKPIIVMSEGSDPRIITGAIAAYNTGTCQIVLIGDQITIKTECKALGVNLPSGVKVIDPEKSVMQCHVATEHMGVESKNMVLEMIAEPLLLTWEQLRAMPAMRTRLASRHSPVFSATARVS